MKRPRNKPSLAELTDRAGASLPAGPRPASVGLPPDTTITFEGSFFRGPVPDPAVLLRFAEVDPSFPVRLFELAERAAAHRQGLQRSHMRTVAVSTYLGLAGALLSVTAVVILGAYLTSQGFGNAAAAMVGTVAVGLVWAFRGVTRRQVRGAPGEPAPTEEPEG